MTNIRTLLLIPAFALLAACGSAPDDHGLQEATKRLVGGAGGATSATAFDDSIAKMKVLGCKKTDSSAYQCDVVGLFGNAQSVRLIKSSDGWVMVQ